MKRLMIPLIAAALLTAACGDSPTAPSPQKPLIGAEHPLVSARLHTLDACGDPTYVGPIRLPISVHGNTVNLSWLGNDGATRGYELEFEHYDVTNVWQFVLRDVVTSPEIEKFLRTPGTYRVRVRGLFCNDQVGGFTDWAIFSTDSEPDNVGPPPPPVICLTSVDGCYPPPCWVLGNCPPPPPPQCLIDCGGDPGDGGGDPGDGEGGHGNPCHLNTEGNPHDGDHNGDGHNDCGEGNDHHHGH